MKTPPVFRGLPNRALSTRGSSQVTTLVATGVGVVGMVAFLLLPLVLFGAFFLTALSSGAFALARTVALRCDEAEPFVHGPTILPPAV